MLLFVCATAMELEVFPEQVRQNDRVALLVGGVGPVESTLSLTRYLAEPKGPAISAVVNFGIGGAYTGSGLSRLDLCFADREVLGDLAICSETEIMDLPDSLTLVRDFSLENSLLAAAEQFCRQQSHPFHRGPFVTLSCTSGSLQRGLIFEKKFSAICENMEGAALARVSQEFGLPFLELRAISNLVENRDPSTWQIREAAAKAATFSAGLALFLLDLSDVV